MDQQKRTFSLAEVAKHNNRQDIWLVIHDKVYDVTKFIDEHPGGEEILLDMAGRVATENFEDVGHSSDARQLMASFMVGEIVEDEKQYTKERIIDWSAVSPNNDSSSSSNNFALAALMVVVLALITYFWCS